ncbi:MAG: orotate phosphoribosyltransferase [Clostridia bacterium]|nr:orotate phosphoribosyltransferase [Clostridia bacterium]
MPFKEFYKIPAKHKNIFLRVSKGHFATSHSHINYYIDVTTQKTRLSEAKAIADELVSYYNSSTIVDTIICLDGTQVIGTCLAEALTEGSFMNLNAHKTIYIVTPENTSGSQLIFRDSTAPMIEGKHVLIVAASVTTGFTARGAIEAIQYYGGKVAGVSAIFATTDDCMGYKVNSVFDLKDLTDYASYSSHECPMCKAGQPVDALVNSFGCSKL